MRIPDALRKPRTIVEIFIAGNLAFLLYTAGIVGVGLLAIPTLTGSAAYKANLASVYAERAVKRAAARAMER